MVNKNLIIIVIMFILILLIVLGILIRFFYRRYANVVQIEGRPEMENNPHIEGKPTQQYQAVRYGFNPAAIYNSNFVPKPNFAPSAPPAYELDYEAN